MEYFEPQPTQNVKLPETRCFSRPSSPDKNRQTFRTISDQVINAQDCERRRLARELHDSIGQYLIAIKINLELLRRTHTTDCEAKANYLLSEALSITDQCLRETRTISQLLHPPLLDQVGFHEALRKYVDSYVNRTGIQTQLQITTGIESLLPHMETTFYRIVQEGLSNIHRHSGSRTAEILLSREGSYVVLEIKDYGTGMPLERLMLCQDQDAVIGVGVAGMRERVSEFGGEFNLYSDHTGTRLIARLPMGERA